MVSVDDVIVEAPDDGEIFDPVGWFATPGEVELEIGSGKGGFLLDRARAHPEKRFVGIEWANKYYRYASDRMARWELENVRVMRTDASHFVRNHLADGCISCLHVYHPDPWPKARHRKRRLFQPAFVEAAIRVLKPGAPWLIQTDHHEYFELIRDLVLGQPQLRELDFSENTDDGEVQSPGTNFEIKYRRENRQIYQLAVVKCA